MASKWIAEKMGDMVEDALKSTLGVDDKDKDKDGKGRQFFSKIFDRDGDKEKKKKLREQSKDDQDDDQDDDQNGFFSKIFDRDGDQGKKEKKSGFSGLFSELEGVDATGGSEGGSEEHGGFKGQSVAVSDGDLLDDLMDVANETSKGN